MSQMSKAVANQLSIDDFEAAQKAAADSGRRLMWIGSYTGEFLGYRLLNNNVRCHSDRIVGIGKIRKLLGLPGWKYIQGQAVAA